MFDLFGHLVCVVLCYVLRYKQLLQRKGELEELEKTLKEQQEKMAQENQSHRATADHCKQLKEENDRSDQPAQACFHTLHTLSIVPEYSDPCDLFSDSTLTIVSW